MEIWTIEDGEKRGPFHDFDVRRRIEAGEIDRDTPAWHEGMEEWSVLGEMSVFDHEFAVRKVVQPPPLPQETDDTAEKPVEKPSFVRRFWARWFDLLGFTALWWFAMWVLGRDIRATLANPWIMLFQMVPWFVIEAFLIHRIGTTPGKWLLGIRVVNDDGSHLSLADATRRAMRVLFIGIGFGWGVVSLVCQGMSWFLARRLGRTLWDQAGGHRVEREPLAPWRVLVLCGLFYGAMSLQWAVVSPYLLEQLGPMFPAVKEYHEKHPSWRLPERNRGGG